MKRTPLYILLLWMMYGSCSNDMVEVEQMFDEKSVQQELAKDVTLYYSDSAVVRVKVSSPVLVRHLDKMNPRDEFPDGLLVEFLDNRKRVRSWLKADYAVRYEKDSKIVVQQNVELYNTQEEKLETSELIWDENSGELSTEKFVKITRPKQGESSMGFGIIVDQNFSRFEIKNKFSATLRVEDKLKSIENE